MKMRKEKILSN